MRTGQAGLTRWLLKVGPGQPDAIAAVPLPFATRFAGVTWRTALLLAGSRPGWAFRLTAPARGQVNGGGWPEVPGLQGSRWTVKNLWCQPPPVSASQGGSHPSLPLTFAQGRARSCCGRSHYVGVRPAPLAHRPDRSLCRLTGMAAPAASRSAAVSRCPTSGNRCSSIMAISSGGFASPAGGNKGSTKTGMTSGTWRGTAYGRWSPQRSSASTGLCSAPRPGPRHEPQPPDHRLAGPPVVHPRARARPQLRQTRAVPKDHPPAPGRPRPTPACQCDMMLRRSAARPRGNLAATRPPWSGDPLAP